MLNKFLLFYILQWQAFFPMFSHGVTLKMLNKKHCKFRFHRTPFSKWSIFIIFSLCSWDAFSINCEKAKKYSEVAVCSDEFLMVLDSAVNRNFRFMLNANIGAGAKKELQATQKEWLKKRDKCDSKACIVRLYKIRLTEICAYPVVEGVHPVCDEFDENEN
ncbi:lysozyme inhibitor LprI family protein [Herbaspirillum rubrisubalbicans]|uniref:lysozyme inhibitor LprI family protein n=1 Tax=Herbaspirillum rubrisubalbicans TaxID=80842 RepID=UPI0015C574D9|nr:hypothetical protein [Herbaspirillum rubrisubalbicans]